MSPVQFEEVANIATEQKSVSGCMTGSYAWGDSWYGSVDGRQWERLDTPSRTHTQNDAPSGWERRGTYTTQGSTGLPGWRAFRYLVRLFVGPDREEQHRHLGVKKTATLVRIPSRMRTTSFSRRERRKATREQRALCPSTPRAEKALGVRKGTEWQKVAAWVARHPESTAPESESPLPAPGLEQPYYPYYREDASRALLYARSANPDLKPIRKDGFQIVLKGRTAEVRIRPSYLHLPWDELQAA